MQSKVESDQLWDPYRYLERTPGKGLRVKHIEAFNAVLEAPEDVVNKIKLLVERLHTVSLLLDDIEDNAALRRGRPVAHSIFGVPRTINSANFVMLETLHEACKVFPECQEILFTELLALHEGQGLDLYWRDTHMCPTELQYEKMVLNKTGGLYRLAVKLLQHYSLHKDLDLVEIADLMGLIYQIQDDLLNLSSERYCKNKGFAEDITEGKYSFPVVHCLNKSKEDPKFAMAAVELNGILRQHTHDLELKEHALHILLDSGSIEYTHATIGRYVHDLSDKIKGLGLKNPEPLLKLLDMLIAVVI